jgi:hypothetical protein
MNGAWSSALPRYKTKPFERLHHLILRGRRHEKVPLNVGFRRSDTKPYHVLLDEFEVFVLARRGLRSGRALSAFLVRRQLDRQSMIRPLDQQREAIHKVNRESSVFGNG